MYIAAQVYGNCHKHRSIKAKFQKPSALQNLIKLAKY